MKASDRIAQTVDALCGKIEDALTLARPADATQYAEALRDAAAAYRDALEGEAEEAEA